MKKEQEPIELRPVFGVVHWGLAIALVESLTLIMIRPVHAETNNSSELLPLTIESNTTVKSDTILSTKTAGDRPIDDAPVVMKPELVFATHVAQASATDTPEPSKTSEVIVVEKIQVVGSTVFTEADWQPLTQPLIGTSVTRLELQAVADAITQLYLERGYITSRAVLIDEGISSGTITLQVLEGRITAIEIFGTESLEGYVRSRVELGSGTPLNTNALEDQLRLLRNDPLFENIEASLRAGEAIGESILVVRVDEVPTFSGNVGIDNYSPPSIGAERLNFNGRFLNPGGLGDELLVSYRPRTANFAGTYRAELNYRVPVNAMNGTIHFSGLLDRNEVIQAPFDDFDIRGRSERIELTYRQPVIRNPREELAFSVGFTRRVGQTFLFGDPFPFGIGPEADGRSRTTVINLGQDYTRRDEAGAWAVRSQFRVGVSGIFGETVNASPAPSSNFFSWLGQFQRVQVINPSNFLILQADVQLTPDPLLPSEQFVIGGGQSVRGYRQNLLAGDNGLRVSIENRITLVRNKAEESIFILAPFFDMGTVWNAGDNPNRIFDSQRFIAALGVGLLWQPIEGLNLRIDYAPPLIDVDTRGSNVQDDGFYFSASYGF